MEKEITVTTNDPTTPVMSLRIKANIVGSIEVLPRAYMAMPMPPDMEYKSRILVRKEKSEKGELNVTEANASVPWIAVKARKVVKAEPPTADLPAAEPGDFIVEATVTDESAIVQSGQQVRFKTGLTRETQSTVPLTVSYQQPLTATPSTLVLSALDGMKEASGTITVALRPNLSSQPVTTSVTPMSFAVKLEPDGDRRYKALVSWKRNEDSPEKLGWVTFMVAGESVRVPVRVRDRAAGPKQAPPGEPQPQLPAPDTPGAAPQPATPGASTGSGAPPPAPSPAPPPAGGASPGAPAPGQKP